MTLSDLLLYYARSGFLEPLRKSAYRKFCRRNRGKESIAETGYGFRMKTTIGDAVDNMIFVYGLFEPGTSAVIGKLSPKCDTLIDVGCNIGFYSCLYSYANPQGRVLAIDPNPEMIRRTGENLDLNSFDNYRTFDYGVSDKTETVTLNIPRKRHSLSSMAYVPGRAGRYVVDQIEVQVKKLHDILAGEKIARALLKVDTEGYEYNVFSGIEPDKCSEIDYIVLEWSAKNLEQAGVKSADLLSLAVFGLYRFYIVNDNGSVTEKHISDCHALDEADANLLLVKKDIDFQPDSFQQTNGK